MERYFSIGQSRQQAVAPTEEEEEDSRSVTMQVLLTDKFLLSLFQHVLMKSPLIVFVMYCGL
jgi:hypothetical protein